MKLIFFLVLLLPGLFHVFENGNTLVKAELDESVEEADAEDDGMVEAVEPVGGADKDEEDESEEKPLKPSPDLDSHFLFTKPAGATFDLPAGKDVQFLVGVTNKGSKDFMLHSLDASFRYPMDFSFYIQNFSTIAFNRVVRPKQQASLYYQFFISESFGSRPFGLSVNLMYKDSDGAEYLEAVFNETVNIIEIDEGLDGETFFLYVFLAACVVLILVGAQQLLSSWGRKKLSKPKVEMGTQNASDVDFDWLPKETLNELHKSPKRSPRQSPRQRRVKRGTGSGDE